MQSLYLAGAAGVAAGALSATGIYSQSTTLLNNMGWKAAGDYTQLGASYALATFPAVFAACWFTGHPRPLLLSAVSSAIMGVMGAGALDPTIMADLGNSGYGIEGGTGGAQDTNFSSYRAATVAIMVGASTALATVFV